MCNFFFARGGLGYPTFSKYYGHHHLSAAPYLPRPRKLIGAVCDAVSTVLGGVVSPDYLVIIRLASDALYLLFSHVVCGERY